MSMVGINPTKAKKLATFLEGDEGKLKIDGISKEFLSIKDDLEKCWISKDSMAVQTDIENIYYALLDMSKNFDTISEWLNHYATQALQSNQS